MAWYVKVLYRTIHRVLGNFFFARLDPMALRSDMRIVGTVNIL